MYERGFLHGQILKEKYVCFCLGINSKAILILSLWDVYGKAPEGRQRNKSTQFIGGQG